MSDEDDPMWVARPLLDAGFDPKHLQSLSEWISFEVIAASQEGRPISFAEIESHMSPEMRVALRETARRSKARGGEGDDS